MLLTKKSFSVIIASNIIKKEGGERMADDKENTSGSESFSWAGAIGFMAFIGGIILSIIAGIAVEPRTILEIDPEIVIGPANHPDTVATVVLILAILGIIVGVLNITAKEVLLLMVAAIALIVVNNSGIGGYQGFDILDKLVGGLGTTITDILNYFGRLMAPAAVIAAVRALFAVGFPG